MSIYIIYIYTCFTVIVFCEVNILCFHNVVPIFVLEDRCRKGFRNVSGTFTVILKFCWNTQQFFLRFRFLIKVCVRTIFEALRRRSPDNGFLVKTVLLNLACGRRPILTLSSLSQSTAIASFYMNIWVVTDLKSTIQGDILQFVPEIVCNAAGCNDRRGWLNENFTEFKNADNKIVISLSQICHKTNFGCFAFPCFVQHKGAHGYHVSRVFMGFQTRISWPGHPWRLSLPVVLVPFFVMASARHGGLWGPPCLFRFCPSSHGVN